MSPNSERFDVVVVGSGFGGAAAALKCAEAGLRTVVVERGGWPLRDDDDWSPRKILLDKRYADASPIEIQLYGERRVRDEKPNAVVGGGSVFYGGASLRLRPPDFARWPICYDEIAPYYDAAEVILGVHGSAGVDPFEPPRSGPYPKPAVDFTPPAQRIRDAAVSLGYRPFPIPLAINFTDEDEPLCIRCVTCDGFPCRIEAKNDITRTFLRRAMAHGLTLIANARVHRLTVAADGVTSVVCVDRDSGASREIDADCVVVAAGAIETPSLLMRSGVGSHRSVGTRLMRHCNEIVSYAFPYRTNPDGVFHKQVCLTDFYEHFRKSHGTATGVIQDIYTPAPDVMRRHAPWWGKWLIDLTHRHVQNLLCVAEDEPREENAIRLTQRLDAAGLPIPRVVHDYTPRDVERNRFLVEQATAILKAAGGCIGHRMRLDTFSHAVGTVRMSERESDGPLDRWCRLRGYSNLYVTDGSCMPASGGVNPSLTIAANAMRVGEEIARGASRG